MTEVELLAKHLQGALSAAENTKAQMQALRVEMYTLARQVKDAEQSRDTVRAHAQAALDKYRAQDQEVQELRTILVAAIDAWDSDDNITDVLERARDFLGLEPRSPAEPIPCGYLGPKGNLEPCTRLIHQDAQQGVYIGHRGPCAHPAKLSGPRPSGGSPQGA